MRIKLLLLIFLLIAPAAFAQEADTLIADNDVFDIFVDDSLNIAAPGLRGNDQTVTMDSLRLVLVAGPTNGTLEFGADGSFSYVPNPGYSGTDEFTYMLETLPLQLLEVDSTQSQIKLNMDVSATALGITFSDSDSTEVSLFGGAALYLDPVVEPAESIQLYDMALTNIDSVDLEFSFGTVLIGGDLFASADSGGIVMNLTERGMTTSVVDSMFFQPNNKLGLTGQVDLVGTRLVEDLIPEDPVVFDTETQLIEIPGSYASTAMEMRLQVPIALQDTFDVGGADVALRLAGDIVGHGTMRQPATSNMATVSITITPQTSTSIGDEVPFKFALSQNYPNPFNPITTIAFSIPSADHVTLKVFDTLGREVTSLIDGTMTPGRHEVQFEASTLPSGMYLYRLSAGDKTEIRKMVVLK